MLSDEKKYCYSQCPFGHTFHDKDAYECKENCGSLPYIPGTSENICVEQCSNTGLPYTEDDVCVIACESGNYVVSGTEKLCVERCLGATGPNADGECVLCVSLEDAPFYVEEEGCSEKCPEYAKFYFDEDKVCMR